VDATRREPTDASWSCRARGDRNADAHFWAASLARSWCGRMGSPVTQDERVTVRDDWQVSRGAENELAGKNVFGVPVRPIPSRRVTAPHVGSATCRRHGSDRPTDRASLSQHATRPSSHVRSGLIDSEHLVLRNLCKKFGVPNACWMEHGHHQILAWILTPTQSSRGPRWHTGCIGRHSSISLAERERLITRTNVLPDDRTRNQTIEQSKTE
jgi:hypothetical protein